MAGFHDMLYTAFDDRGRVVARETGEGREAEEGTAIGGVVSECRRPAGGGRGSAVPLDGEAGAMYERIAAVHPAIAAAMTHVDSSREPRLERILSEIRTHRKQVAAAQG